MPSLQAFLGLDATNFQAGMRHAQATAQNVGREFKSSLGSSLAGFGGAVAGGALVYSIVETTERIRKLSNEFRVSTDTVQIWERAAHKVDMTAEDVGNAFNRLKKAREQAVQKQDAGGFAQFGIGLSDLESSATTTEQIMERMRSFTAGRPITDQEDVAGMELMGKSGAKILSVMQEINKMGPIDLIKGKDIEAIHELEASLARIKHEATTVGASLAGRIIEPSIKLVEGGVNLVARLAAGTVESFTGRESINQAFGINGEGDRDIPAPTHDLKGRPLNGPKAKPVGEGIPAAEAIHAPITLPNEKRIAELKKEQTELEAEQARLAEKILQNHLKALPALEREVELKRQIKSHEAAAAFYDSVGGEDLAATKERLKAEELRGQLKQDHKLERFNFSSAENMGDFSASAGALHNAGMDAAQKTAQHTHDTFVAIKELISVMRGYNKPTVTRGQNTHWAVTGEGPHF